ncbi:gliding motility lipoprotein GldD [Vicingaceae bacterium]|nr:gliding motility lipoprotein GldD [Vicingaceae bacterium]MDB4062371.1 gliding motility lipoprotein GldD [Vicingaceae bacterium]
MKRLLIPFLLLLLIACQETPFPKPTGYFRIDLPKKEYSTVDSIPFPFQFELTQYANVNLDRTKEDSRFLNVDFPSYGARVHMSYLKIDSNLPTLLDDARTLVYKHLEKAQDISETSIRKENKRVYGVFYTLDGNTASGSQFYLTDSTNHFVRGALYFNVVPNFDSIAPVQTFIEQDIQHLIETINWK